MNLSEVLFWNVDTQYDFVSPNGKLYVEGADSLRSTWDKLTKLAAKKSIRVVNTADFHYENSAELSSIPDFVSTFPQHCMANTHGAEFIKETNPDDPLIFDWDKNYIIDSELLDSKKSRNIVIRKDAFDVFAGNRHTGKILKIISPKNVIVYGVTTNVCVNDAVIGLVNREKNVYVIEDAIKELPKIQLPFKKWQKLGVIMIKFKDLEIEMS